MKRQNLINSKTVFLSTLIVAPTVTLLVYFSGLHAHRSLYLNCLLSTTILSLVFFVFIATGLYRGWKLKETMGSFRDRFDRWERPSSVSMDVSGFDADGVETDGMEGCVIMFFIWIVVGLFGSLLFWLVGALVWGAILIVAGMLYWIVFRSFRLIFRHSAKCRGDLLKSTGTALLYTTLYNCWIYAIILGTHYLQQP